MQVVSAPLYSIIARPVPASSLYPVVALTAAAAIYPRGCILYITLTDHHHDRTLTLFSRRNCCSLPTRLLLRDRPPACPLASMLHGAWPFPLPLAAGSASAACIVHCATRCAHDASCGCIKGAKDVRLGL